jgi:hypothetical protein
MTLVSPGVSVTVIDQSQYLPAPTNSVPFILFATAQNKAQPNSTSVAPGTTAANAGKLYQITSQQDLVNTYGNPFFYTTTNGTPIQGYELNEYGLLAAYSALGVTNQVYCLRADIDLASLVGSTGRPVGNPASGTYWLDATNTTWGINVFDAVTGQFNSQTPIVITSTTQLSGNAPLQSIGSIYQYAVVAIPNYNFPSSVNAPIFFQKISNNTWQPIGSAQWMANIPTVSATLAPSALNPGDTITIGINGGGSTTLTIPASPNNTVNWLVGAINALGLSYLSAGAPNGYLLIYSHQTGGAFSNVSNPFYITVSGSNTLLAALGINQITTIPVQSVISGNTYQIITVGGTDFTTLGASNSNIGTTFTATGNGISTSGNGTVEQLVAVSASSVVSGKQYQIVTVGTTNWTSIGAGANTVGTVFTATGAGTGTGTAVLIPGTGAASTYYQPSAYYGTSAQQPLWQAGQATPMPTGSVWFKVGSAGNGLNSVINQYNTATASWVPQSVSYATDDWNAIAALDSTGGQVIPAGSIYTQYWYDKDVRNGWSNSPVYYWERIATGPTIITGSNNAPAFGGTSYTANVYVTIPGSSSLSNPYTFSATLTTATDFVTAWAAAGIPYTSATVTATGSIQLTHTQGGVIIVNDVSSITGYSNGLMTDAGFVIGTTQGVKEGPFSVVSYTPTQTSTTGVGTNLQINVTNYYQSYYVNPTSFVNAGSGYAVGDKITIRGSAIGGVTGTNDLVVTVESVNAGAVTAIGYYSGAGAIAYSTQLSNWQEFTMEASTGAPYIAPANGTNWFFSVVDQVDIMVNTTSGWKGYRNVCFNSAGFPLPSGTPATDINGPLVSATMPTAQSTGNPLQYGDLWIDTSDLVNYPMIYRWELSGPVGNQTAQWVMIDNTDDVNSSGVIFQDARWATDGNTDPATDAIPSIQSLLTSNYLDMDAPSHSLYPVGMLLWNTRRSGYNVKQYNSSYFNTVNFPGQSSYPAQTAAWVTASGNMSNGAPYMGSQAQRAMVVKALGATINTNTAILDEDTFFNLIACPNYPEMQPDMVTLNDNRGQTGFIVGDTPMTLPADATSLVNWATNAAGAATTGLQGCVTRDTYMGLFYPSGTTTDLNGNIVVVPPSHMMIRTFLRNDNIAYPWFAAAGTRRGIIDNATSIGYIDQATGNFVSIKTSLGIRDTLYENNINPLVFFTGQGLLCYGNISSYASQSSLDRINVARLVAYLRRQLTLAARPFVFEPNDAITRSQISGVIQSLLVSLVATRGIYDYLVVCDLSNNTPTTIDQNELWVDVAIEPVKAVEFIYIPVRLLATGTLGNNNG